MPGPASSVVECSLGNFFSFTRGPWFESPLLLSRDLFFKIFAQMFDGKSNYGTGYISHATLPIKKRLWQHLYWVKRNVASEIGHMTEWTDDVILLYYAILQYTSNLRQYHLTGLTDGGVRALIGLGQDDGRSHRPSIWRGGCRGRKEDNRTVSRTWDTPWNRGCPG